MKKFARCTLILILVFIASAVGGYLYLDNTIKPQYESTARLYVTPNDDNNASIRATDGGLNDDFMIIFTSEIVMSQAQQYAGTTEDISEYLTVTSPANSNIVELTVTNPDLDTAKLYVDSVAKAAVKANTIIPVESIKILSDGTSIGGQVKPNLYRYTIYIVALACGVCLFLELLICLILAAFKKKDNDDDYNYEYERRFATYPYARKPVLIESKTIKTINHDDILESIDDDYEESNFSSKPGSAYPVFNAIDDDKKPERSLWEEAQAAEKAAKEAEEKAAKEAEEQAAKEAVEKAMKEAEEKAMKEAEEKAAKEAEEQAAKEAEEKAAKEAAEQAAKEAEERAIKEAEEKAMREAAEQAAREAEEAAKQVIEESTSSDNTTFADDKTEESSVEEKELTDEAVLAAQESVAAAYASLMAEQNAKREVEEAAVTEETTEPVAMPAKSKVKIIGRIRK